jgi:ATP-binding cassette, subfamily B, multidrug efflux pump
MALQAGRQSSLHQAKESAVLLKLLAQFLRPHRWLLAGVIFFQLGQSIASLYLPTLNADIVDNGIAKGNTSYIFSVGAVMLGVTLLQVACAITAVYFGAKAAMRVGRDMRNAIFTRVGESPRLARRHSSPATPMMCNKFRCWC